MEVANPLPVNIVRAGFPTGYDKELKSTYSEGSLAGSKIRRVGLVIFKGILK